MKDGVTRTYRWLKGTYRYPKGTQVSVRSTENEMLIVCHSFEEPHPERMMVEIPEGFAIVDEFANDSVSIEGRAVIIEPMKALTACAVYANRRGLN